MRSTSTKRRATHAPGSCETALAARGSPSTGPSSRCTTSQARGLATHVANRLRGAPSSWTTEEFPFVLMAGERRSFTANDIIRDPGWRRRDASGALRISLTDAERLGVTADRRARVATQAGCAEVSVEITDMMQSGHVSLPNGLGVDYPTEDGSRERTGVAPNDLTSARHRDEFAGTPWHKYVPARIEAVG
ncbi:molybdopterin dinucleotide binding domain-containing protein [Saccharopolyspora mangrovi]|uniref:Molybdopterin dinucleotide binding domain-containing protein n=1 Tax=Saccharopolyspora mangrovi TaxID=3082379 RepID=A0ABU6AJ07_9PSEU|nr:molybdopterin dinucleotide binding domain-containing protein [Saccharopolyspora sp. S2-29]MEB3371559.1 molybdopterin dinucleotide binding domain-containing protein [Saccharopolyspora sp. S2-29]